MHNRIWVCWWHGGSSLCWRESPVTVPSQKWWLSSWPLRITSNLIFHNLKKSCTSRAAARPSPTELAALPYKVHIWFVKYLRFGFGCAGKPVPCNRRVGNRTPIKTHHQLNDRYPSSCFWTKLFRDYAIIGAAISEFYGLLLHLVVLVGWLTSNLFKCV